jgi:hypothetical protein
VVTANIQRLVKVATCAIQLLVAILGFKLNVFDNMRCVLANMAEAIVVDVLSAIVDAIFALALVTCGEHGLEGA